MRDCTVVRVFAVGASGGNPLGVVTDSDGLDTTRMQEIAAELGFSETTFTDWAPGHQPSLRIFTPAAEMPFAGHPLVGTAWVLNQIAPVERLTIQIGEVGVRFDGDVVWVGPPSIDQPVRAVDEAEVRALGVPATQAWRVEVPSDYLVAEVATESDLLSITPDADSVAAAADGFYVFCPSSPTRSRFFAPRLGVYEDPATGSAAVALCAVRRSLGMEAGSETIMQGLPEWLSKIHMTWDGLEVELGGTVVLDEVRELDW